MVVSPEDHVNRVLLKLKLSVCGLLPEPKSSVELNYPPLMVWGSHRII